MKTILLFLALFPIAIWADSPGTNNVYQLRSPGGAGLIVAGPGGTSSKPTLVETTHVGWVATWNGTAVDWEASGGGGGGVTSVALALPSSVFNISGSPVTTTGTLAGSFAAQAANACFMGPVAGSPGTPAFRSMVAADIPALPASKITSGQGSLTSSTAGVTATGTNAGLAAMTVDIQTATTALPGLLSAADWTTFNAKLGVSAYAQVSNKDLADNSVGFYSPSSGAFFSVLSSGATAATRLRLINNNTADRTATFPDKSGTIAFTSDIPTAVTSVTGVDPIQSSGGTTPILSCIVATGSVAGCLSATDWNTFNNKQSTLTFSPPLVNTAGTVTCNAASGSVTGCLSSTDWTTFNNKGSGTVTAVSVASANGFAGSSSGGATPALTLSTSITGLLKGNGTAISAASSGTDYALPNENTNLTINPDFYLWPRGTSVTVANGVSTYQAANYYVKNSLGTNGVITYSQTGTAASGSTYGAQVKITTAPTAAQADGAELWQTLGTQDSMRFFNNTGSASVQVQSLNNVTQVGLQFFYATTQAKATVAIGSEATCTVNSSGFTLCSNPNVAMGTSMTTSGTVGYRLRITAVSSGNTYDINNGFIASQYQLNTGAVAGTFFRPLLGQVISNVRRYIVSDNAPPFNATGGHLWEACWENSTTRIFCSKNFGTDMIAAPTYTAVSVTGFKVSDKDGDETISAVTSTIRTSTGGAQIQFTGSWAGSIPSIETWAVNNTVWQYFSSEL